MEDEGRYPSILQCVCIIAEATGAKVSSVASSLLEQAKELGISSEEIVHRQYDMALKTMECKAGG